VEAGAVDAGFGYQCGLDALEYAPGSAATSQLAARQIGVQVGQIAKSMLFKSCRGEYFMVVCPGNLRVDNKKLKQAVGAKARMANAQETLQVTGFKPGSVCPFGVSNARILIDRPLAAYETVYPAAGTDGSGVPMSFAQLVSITGGEACDVMEPD